MRKESTRDKPRDRGEYRGSETKESTYLYLPTCYFLPAYLPRYTALYFSASLYLSLPLSLYLLHTRNYLPTTYLSCCLPFHLLLPNLCYISIRHQSFFLSPYPPILSHLSSVIRPAPPPPSRCSPLPLLSLPAHPPSICSLIHPPFPLTHPFTLPRKKKKKRECQPASKLDTFVRRELTHPPIRPASRNRLPFKLDRIRFPCQKQQHPAS